MHGRARSQFPRVAYTLAFATTAAEGLVGWFLGDLDPKIVPFCLHIQSRLVQLWPSIHLDLLAKARLRPPPPSPPPPASRLCAARSQVCSINNTYFYFWTQCTMGSALQCSVHSITTSSRWIPFLICLPIVQCPLSFSQLRFPMKIRLALQEKNLTHSFLILYFGL